MVTNNLIEDENKYYWYYSKTPILVALFCRLKT